MGPPACAIRAAPWLSKKLTEIRRFCLRFSRVRAIHVTTAQEQRLTEKSIMATFTIDSENNIVAHAGTPASDDPLQLFSTEEELAKFAAAWPGSRLVEVWNSFAGVTPFDDLKPVKKFTSRQTAVARIWQAVARLSPDAAPPAVPASAKSNESPAKAQRRGTAPKSARSAPKNKKAQVIAMMKRPKGVTLAEIMEATGWQKHTVRGFVSILSRKSGEKIESSKNSSGERSYRIAK
jgi:hypothetical protein